MLPRTRRLAAAIIAFCLVPLLAAGGAGATEPPTEPAFPGAEWETTTPADAGIDEDTLGGIALEVASYDSACFLVVRHGQLVAEWYWKETTPEDAHQVFSVTKSFTSALVGMALADGAIDIAQPAADFIPDWEGTPADAVTIENLLSNDSGREWSFDLDYVDLVGSADRSAFAVGLDQTAEPGSEWVYNNAAIQTLSEVLQASTGVEPAEFAESELFGPLGMADTDMATDEAGNTATFFGITSTCRDLARFGLLYLNEGNWGGTEVVPADYVEASVGQPSQDLTANYGYLWWLNRPGPILGNVLAPIVTGAEAENTVEGPTVPGAPEDMYWAQGLFGQIIQVDPGSDTVVVRLGGEDIPVEITSRAVTEALTG